MAEIVIKQKRAKFFKIVINPRVYKLRIPASFVRQYGEALPERVFIRDPDGLEWIIGLVQSDDEIWLENGMEVFMKYYSINFGHLLVFQYDFGSYFDVSIFDMSATEIEYVDDATIVPKVELEGSELDTSIEIMKDSSDKKCKGKTLHDETEEDGCLNKRKRQKVRKPVGCVQTLPRQGPGSRIRKDRIKETRTVNRHTSVAYKRAIAFRDKNTVHHLSFASVMQPYYISNSILTVPKFIARSNLKKNSSHIKLRTSNGERWWCVRCFCGTKTTQITTGFRTFVEDNGVKVGDACVFQVNKSDKCVWDVTIFRK